MTKASTRRIIFSAVVAVAPAALGCSGEPGAPGPVGGVGPEGTPGVTGVTGTPGSVGPTGPPGPTGAMGVSGPPGMTGPSGPSGVGIFCGALAGHTGDLGGYGTAKLLCEAVCSDTDAHMCTASEVVMSAQLGALPSSSFRYATGLSVTGALGSAEFTPTNDCHGWTSELATAYSTTWLDIGAPQPAVNTCDAVMDVACCL